MAVVHGTARRTSTSHSATDPFRPPTLGPWQLGRLLQSGPLAEVFEAKPTDAMPHTGWHYVLKRLHTHWEGEPRAIDLFTRGVRVGREIAHPHLVAVLDARIEAAPYHAVMPRLEGEPLDALLRGGRRIELPLALWFVRQAAEVLAALHRRDWLHADVKPANMMLGPTGHVTLMDLDFARRFTESGSTMDRWVAGTFQYIAPEMITSAGCFDGRSDIYSLGATLFEMLAGRPPYLGHDLADLATQHRQARQPNLAQLAPGLPDAVVDLTHRMLAKEPLRRPHAASEVVSALVALEISTLPRQVALKNLKPQI